MAWMGITVTGDGTTRPALTTSLWWPFEHAADPFASARDAALDLRPPSIALHQVRREGTGDALGLQWVGRVHELEVHVGSGRVTSVPDQPQDLTGPTIWPVVTNTVPGAKCANSAKTSVPCTITWIPATRSTPPRADRT